MKARNGTKYGGFTAAAGAEQAANVAVINVEADLVDDDVAFVLALDFVDLQQSKNLDGDVSRAARGDANVGTG